MESEPTVNRTLYFGPGQTDELYAVLRTLGQHHIAFTARNAAPSPIPENTDYIPTVEVIEAGRKLYYIGSEAVRSMVSGDKSAGRLEPPFPIDNP